MAFPVRNAVLTSPPAFEALGLVDGLAQLTFAVQGALVEVASAHELSVAQARLLGILRDRRPTIKDLASLMRLDKSSVTGLVDRAEDRGLVRRKPSTLDRRSVHVVITAAGKRLVGAALSDFESQIRKLTHELSQTQKAQLADIAGLVVAADARRGPAN